ncbi:phosphoglycerate mutase family protein [Sphingosinicella sp. LHD-64]|uniref:phosphoglycerate mutase family protein n=1 Tax=Sphingosinicella sp. LHD-64 TaxID=3072139 RepID=UPI00280D8944|nr:phosphoglycerate mutase family protein [Sphingosinicella sp. LHD-64]MDQ8755646.1 phosphoglycerate mutase family protein [Sphingosinicella sp. LHD-64]
MLARFLAALFLALIPAAAPAETSTQPLIYVMRHLNTPAGERDPDLLPEGRETAEALAAWFPADAQPTVIYVSDFKRTRQTAAPLAARLGLTPVVYDPADTPALVARVQAERGPVLIVGHSNTVPDIVAALGGTRPAALVHEDFGEIWRVTPDGATARARIAQ